MPGKNGDNVEFLGKTPDISSLFGFFYWPLDISNLGVMLGFSIIIFHYYYC